MSRPSGRFFCLGIAHLSARPIENRATKRRQTPAIANLNPKIHQPINGYLKLKILIADQWRQ